MRRRKYILFMGAIANPVMTIFTGVTVLAVVGVIVRHWLANAYDVFAFISTFLILWILLITSMMTLDAQRTLILQVAKGVPQREDWPLVPLNAAPLEIGEEMILECRYVLRKRWKKVAWFLTGIRTMVYCLSIISGPILMVTNVNGPPTFWKSIFYGLISLCYLRAVFYDLRQHMPQRILADDHGITIQRGKWQSQHMRWDEISSVIRLGDDSRLTKGLFVLFKSTRELDSSLIFKELSFVPLNARYTGFVAYFGGYETYIANVERLLATLNARIDLPIRQKQRTHAKQR